MELRKLRAGDYDELLEMLNTVFAKQHQHEMDFFNELPKMWIRDDKHMGYHTGIFEDNRLVSVAGLYPLPVKIGHTSLLFANTGNVATLPEYEGRGYFNTIFTELMKELDLLGMDAARLGGARQRYARFGYEPAASSYQITFNQNNRIKYYHDAGNDIQFREIQQNDTEALVFCYELSRKADIYVEHSCEENYREVYLALCSKHAAPYLAMRGNVPIGYLAATADNQFVGRSQNGRHIFELRSASLEDYVPIVCAWQRHVSADITLKIAPHMTEQLRLLTAGAEYVSITSPSRFKIINYEKIADALLKLKAQKMRLPEGKLILGIEGYGNIKLYVDHNNAGCIKTTETPELSLDRLAATKLLFGHLPAYATADIPNPLCAGWLPLPLSWDTLDYV